MIIKSREKDLGGIKVRRILPYISKRMVGPFIFFDHMGPDVLEESKGLDVRPHPHINLATVTYLFEGKILHRDSLGYEQLIEPGAINWMTAGKGIVHSERSPDFERKNKSKLHGIQLWVALPVENEEEEPNFFHHSAESLPEFKIDQSNIRLLLGSLLGHKSPVKIHSDLFYAEIRIKKDSALQIPIDGYEAAIYVVEGSLKINQNELNNKEMIISTSDKMFEILAKEDTLCMLIGGKSIGPRYIFWNFVSSSKERIEEAKTLWAPGPHKDNPRFTPIPGDDKEFIRLPEDKTNVKGTPM